MTLCCAFQRLLCDSVTPTKTRLARCAITFAGPVDRRTGRRDGRRRENPTGSKTGRRG
jgi:hypothetical protein